MAHEHHLNEFDDLVGVLLDGEEAESHQLAELAELLRLDSSKHLNHFSGQLEGCLLEFQTLARGVREQEAEIDVHDVPGDVDHDVPIVAVLDLKDVAYQGVGGERLAKVVACFLELYHILLGNEHTFRFPIAELQSEVVYQLGLLAHLLLDGVD